MRSLIRTVAAPVVGLSLLVAGLPAHAEDSPQRQYELNYIGVAGAFTTNSETGAMQPAGVLAWRGIYGKPLPGADFYDAVGRPDLAASYRSRSHLRTALAVPGLTIAVGGTVAMFTGLEMLATSKPGSNGRMKTALNVFLAGCIAEPLGGVLALPAMAVNPDPVSVPEILQLADEHNRALRESLGLPVSDEEMDAPARATATPAPKLALGIQLAPGGAGLSLTTTF